MTACRHGGLHVCSFVQPDTCLILLGQFTIVMYVLMVRNMHAFIVTHTNTDRQTDRQTQYRECASMHVLMCWHQVTCPHTDSPSEAYMIEGQIDAQSVQLEGKEATKSTDLDISVSSILLLVRFLNRNPTSRKPESTSQSWP